MGGQYRLWAGGGLVLRVGEWVVTCWGVEVWEDDVKILGWDSYIFCSLYN
jgi:hypothetical protein